MKKIFTALFLTLTLAMFSGLSWVYAGEDPQVLDAQNQTGKDSINSPSVTKIFIDNPLKVGNSIPALLSSLLNDVVLPIGAVLCVFAFIFAGFKYVTAQGNEGEIEKAHKALLYASIGTVVLLGSWVIAKALCNTIHELGGPACPTRL